MKKFVFLDRDGVINKYPGDRNYVLKEEDFHILPGVGEAIRKLKTAGFRIFVVSNQACVSKGLMSKEALVEMTEKFLAHFDKEGAYIEGVYYCLHKEEDNCPFRKPNAGLVFEIYRQNNVDWEKEEILSYFVGDSIIDVKTAQAAKCKSILVFSGRESLENKENWELTPDYTAEDLALAAELIINSQPK